MRTTVDEDGRLAKESHLGHILGVQTTLSVVAVIVVCLRVYVRTRLVRSPGSDDWTMVVAAVCSIVGWILFVFKACHRLGRHIQFIAENDRIKITQASFWQVIICSAAGIALLKVSIALNLLRFSPTRWYTVCLWAGIGLSSAYSLVAVMTFFLHCRPMQAHWDTRIKDARCYPVRLFVIFALVNTSFNIFTDILFATLPIPLIWSLQMKRRVRMYLIGVLSLGYITVGLGIVKSIYQIAYAKNSDPFFDDSILFWALAQFNTGIIAACVPSLKPLVSCVFKLSQHTNSRSRSHALDGSSAADRYTSRNNRRMWSMHRGGQYALEELQSYDDLEMMPFDEVQLHQNDNKQSPRSLADAADYRGRTVAVIKTKGQDLEGNAVSC